MNRITIHIEIDGKLKKLVKVKAAKEGKTIKNVVIELLNFWLNSK